MKTLIIIPAYNEQKCIENTIREVKACGMDVDYLVVNDCSKDHTLEILEKIGASYVNLPVNLGIGGGMQTGYLYAKENGYDIAVQIDGDGQHDPRYLQAVIAPIQRGEADLVIGSRFLEKEGFQSSAARRMGITFLSFLIERLCGVKVLDVTSGMRAAGRKVIERFADSYPQDYPEPEVVLSCGLEGLRIREVPVVMRERGGGVSSINTMRSAYYMIKVSLALILSRLSHRKQVKA